MSQIVAPVSVHWNTQLELSIHDDDDDCWWGRLVIIGVLGRTMMTTRSLSRYVCGAPTWGSLTIYSSQLSTPFPLSMSSDLGTRGERVLILTPPDISGLHSAKDGREHGASLLCQSTFHLTWKMPVRHRYWPCFFIVGENVQIVHSPTSYVEHSVVHFQLQFFWVLH